MNGDFYGIPTGSIGNEHLRLEYLTQAGLRIVRLFPTGVTENVLAELPDVKWDTPYGPYRFHGGHRLWHAPEAFPRCYLPESNEVAIERLPDGVRLHQPAEAVTGIRKSIEIHVQPDRPAVTVDHWLHNEGLWRVELAAWGLTQLPLGGLAVLPQEGVSTDASPYAPNRHLVFWPYGSVEDARLHIHDDYVFIAAQPQLPPCKVGYFNRRGWIGYLRRGVFFCKRFEPQLGQTYPDCGSNVESFCNNLFIELETLAPLRSLEPGQSVRHTERWELHTDIDVPHTLDGVRGLAKALNL
jgi:hypothetical protein